MVKNKNKIQESKTDRIFQLVLYLVLAVIIVLILYPLYFVIIASVSNPLEVFAGKVFLYPKGLNFDVYAAVQRNEDIWVGYRNTILYTTVGTSFNVLFTMMGAYALSRNRMFGQNVIMFYILFTMFFNGGLIPTYLLVNNLKLYNTFWIMILLNLVGVYNLIVARTYLQTTISDQLYEACYKVEYECIPDDAFIEKRNLAFASNALPDFVMRARLTIEEEAKYAAAKQIIALEPYFKDYAPYFSQIIAEDPSVLKNTAMPDGRVYSMPQLNKTEGNLVNNNWINKTWLDNLGHPMPTTIEEFYNTLVAFRDQDPNGNGKKDEIPFSINKLTITELFANFWAVWGFGNHNGIIDSYSDIDDNGKVRIIPTDPHYKDMLTFFNKLWTENLLDHEVFSQKQPQVVAKIDQDLVGFANNGNNQQWMGSKRDQYVQPPAFTGPYGDTAWNSISPFVQTTGTFIITSVNKHPEATMRWVDYYYSEEGTLLVRMGIEGKSYSVNNGKYELLPKIKNDPNGLTLDEALSKWGVFVGGSVPQLIVDKVDASAAQLPEIKASTEVLRPAMIPFSALPRLKYTAEESNQLGRYATDIKNFINENSVKFVTGERPLEEFDQFVSDLKKMNLDEYIAIQQASFDRWNK